jgi:hypothetical protein
MDQAPQKLAEACRQMGLRGSHWVSCTLRKACDEVNDKAWSILASMRASLASKVAFGEGQRVPRTGNIRMMKATFASFGLIPPS